MQNSAPPGEASLSPTRILVAGIASAAVGIVLFLGVHAVLIMPVWPTPLRIVTAIAVGGAAAWAFEELRRAGAFPQRLLGGAAFGGMLWLVLVPENAFGALLRLTGLRSVFGVWELVVEIGLVVGCTAAFAWWMTRSKRGVVALSVGGVLLMFLTGGPLPMTASRPAIGLFVSFLPMFSLCGVVLAATRAALVSR